MKALQAWPTKRRAYRTTCELIRVHPQAPQLHALPAQQLRSGHTRAQPVPGICADLRRTRHLAWGMYIFLRGRARACTDVDADLRCTRHLASGMYIFLRADARPWTPSIARPLVAARPAMRRGLNPKPLRLSPRVWLLRVLMRGIWMSIGCVCDCRLRVTMFPWCSRSQMSRAEALSVNIGEL